MRSTILCAGLLACCTFAHATVSQWTFTYTGFYSEHEETFLPDWTLSGTFAGEDSNADGILQREELSSLQVGYVDYITCESNEYHKCSTSEFAFRLPGQAGKMGFAAADVTDGQSAQLAFKLGFASRDPEWFVGAGRSISTGLSDYSYMRDPGRFVEETYSWRPETALSVTALAAPVPEPATWALFGAGLAALLAAARRRQAQRAAPAPLRAPVPVRRRG